MRRDAGQRKETKGKKTKEKGKERRENHNTIRKRGNTKGERRNTERERERGEMLHTRCGMVWGVSHGISSAAGARNPKENRIDQRRRRKSSILTLKIQHRICECD